jgi:hypothetical protein
MNNQSSLLLLPLNQTRNIISILKNKLNLLNLPSLSNQLLAQPHNNQVISMMKTIGQIISIIPSSISVDKAHQLNPIIKFLPKNFRLFLVHL